MRQFILIFIAITLLVALILSDIFIFKNNLITKLIADLTGSYIITPSAGPNGKISPSSIVTLGSGQSQMFTIAANGGYHIQDVLVDGSSIGGQTFYTFTNVTENHNIVASFSPNEKSFNTIYGGPSAKSKGINYLNYLFVKCPTPSEKESWVQLLKTLKIKLALFYGCFVGGDFTPIAPNTPQELKDTVAYFKANSIAVILHHYADLMNYTSEIAKDTRNIRHGSDGALLSIWGGYLPTPAASSIVAENMANAYNYYGFDGGIYFDAIDYYYHSDLLSDYSTGGSFMNKVIKAIPGGAPIDAASQLYAALPLYTRNYPADPPRGDLKKFADEHVAQIILEASQRVPFMGWLQMSSGSTYSVSDLEYYFDKGRSIGASYAITSLFPSNYNIPKVVPYVAAAIKYNTTWNPRVIAVQDPNGVPMAGVTVQVSDAQGNAVFSGITTTGITPGHKATVPGWVFGNLGALNGPYTIKTQYNSKTQTNTDGLDSMAAITLDTKIIFSCGDGICNNGETCSSCAADCGDCVFTCTQNWSCESWSACDNSQQTRICADSNNCSEITDEPATSQSCANPTPAAPACGDGNCNGSETCSSCVADCGACIPIALPITPANNSSIFCSSYWQCSDQGPCKNSEQVKKCIDLNRCLASKIVKIFCSSSLFPEENGSINTSTDKVSILQEPTTTNEINVFDFIIEYFRNGINNIYLWLSGKK